MKALLLIMSFGLLFWFSGCTTQGRLTYQTFKSSNDYATLSQSLEALKKEGRDGSIQQQFSALKELRYISKYMKDPLKRELAVQTLVFLAFASDDGDIRARSLSRLKAILQESTWETYLKLSVISSIENLITGKSGDQVQIGTDAAPQTITLGITSGERQDALDFLIAEFESLPLLLQYNAVESMHRILHTEPTLTSCPQDLCDETMRANPDAWNVVADQDSATTQPPEEKQAWNEELDGIKETLWDEIDGWLSNSDLDPLILGKIARFSGEAQNYHLLPEKEQRFIELTDEWLQNGATAQALKDIVSASKERMRLYGIPANQATTLSSSTYQSIDEGTAAYLETHVDSVFYQQILLQEAGKSAKLAAGTFLFTPLQKDEVFDPMKPEIIALTLTQNLKRGLLLENTEIFMRIVSAINSASIKKTETGRIELQRWLKLVEQIYPSMEASMIPRNPMLMALAQGLEQETDRAFQRLYLQAMLASVTTQ